MICIANQFFKLSYDLRCKSIAALLYISIKYTLIINKVNQCNYIAHINYSYAVFCGFSAKQVIIKKNEICSF